MDVKVDEGWGVSITRMRRRVSSTPQGGYRGVVPFEPRERVRLTAEASGVPAGTEGIVMHEPKQSPGKVWVQWYGYGAHEVAEANVERVDEPA